MSQTMTSQLSGARRPRRGEERRADVIAAISRGQGGIAQLAENLGVSEMTVRRDLELLEHEGVLLRVRGGAVLRVSGSYEPPREQRALAQSTVKVRIGLAAARLMNDGETGIIDVGTTALAVADALKGRRGITLVTASLPAAVALANEPDIRVFMPGGRVRGGELSLTGGRAITAIGDFNCDVAFIGVAGIDADAGLTDYNIDDAEVKRGFVGSARRRVLVADATKLGVVAFARVAPLDVVDTFVTDADPSHPLVAQMIDRGVSVITV